MTSHMQLEGSAPAARAERVKCFMAGITEEWLYFKSRWSDYVRATRLDSIDKIFQFLVCCDEQLRKDHTRNQRDTFTGMTEDNVFTGG